MSLLSPETLHVFVAPQRVLALQRVGWTRRLGQTRSYDFNDTHVPGWDDMLNGFATALKELKGDAVRVVLSSHYVQYRVLPWRADIRGDAEYEALARLGFSDAFGTLADAWSVSLSDERPGQARLAAAVPTELLQGLKSLALAAGTKLETVQPYLAAAVSLWERQITVSGNHWLLVCEPGRVCALARDAGALRWVRHARVGEDWAETLTDFLASEAVLAGVDITSAKVQVLAPGAGPTALAALRAAGYQTLVVPSERGFGHEQHGAFAPAWIG